MTNQRTSRELDVSDVVVRLEDAEMETVAFVFVANENCCLWPRASAGVRLLESRLFPVELRPDEFYKDGAKVTRDQAIQEYRRFLQLVNSAEKLNVPHAYVFHRYGQTKSSLEVFGMDKYEALDQIRAYLANELREWSDFTS